MTTIALPTVRPNSHVSVQYMLDGRREQFSVPAFSDEDGSLTVEVPDGATEKVVEFMPNTNQVMRVEVR